MRRNVHVLGSGMVSSLGVGTQCNWEKIVSGQSGIRPIERFNVENLAVNFAACVDTWKVDSCAERILKMALVATGEAIEQSGLTRKQCEKAKLFMAIPLPEFCWSDLISNSSSVGARNYGTQFISGISNAVAEEIGTSSIPYTLSTACASSATAIVVAVGMLRRGEIETAIVLGSDSSIFEESIVRFNLLNALSTKNDSYQSACSPFSLNRDGFVLGEGAAALVLQSEDRVDKTRSIAMITGVGEATDDFHRTRSHPSGDTIVESISKAIADAGLEPGMIDHVNAHGTSTPENDKMEALGISRVLGPHAAEVTVTSNKSAIGHTLTAAAILEVAFALETFRSGVLPPTLNYDSPDLTLGLNVVGKTALAGTPKHILKNSFGFGGQNVSLVLSRGNHDAF